MSKHQHQLEVAEILSAMEKTARDIELGTARGARLAQVSLKPTKLVLLKPRTP